MSMTNSDHFDDTVIIPSIRRNVQLDIFGNDSLIALEPADPHVRFDCPDLDLSDYDLAIVSMSGGKDSIAGLCRLLDMGFPKEKIELWHNHVDGDPLNDDIFFDWNFMYSYNKKLAEAFGIPLYCSWLNKGLRGEMLKHNSIPQPHSFETPAGIIELGRETCKPGTRRKFPQQSASLTTRWCSSALKVDPAKRALTNQERFIGKRVLFITGERREESSSRNRFSQLQPHAVDTERKSKNPKKPRYIDSWRNVLHLTEEDVWQILSDWRITPPVPYRLGWGRSSCNLCIFSSDRVLATINEHWPERILEVADYENQFGVTIARSGKNVLERATSSTPFVIDDVEALQQSFQKEYALPIFVPDNKIWTLPKGAFSTESSGSL